MEIVDYATYDSATVMFDVMGFGKPLDEIPMLLQPGVLSLAWGSVVRQLAAGLGIELDEVTERHVRVPAPEDFDIASGHIPKGSAAALRFEVHGLVDGKPAVVLEHVTRLREDLCPDWPQPAQPGGSYRDRDHRRTVLRRRRLPEQSATATTITPVWWRRRCASSTPSPPWSPPRRNPDHAGPAAGHRPRPVLGGLKVSANLTFLFVDGK